MLREWIEYRIKELYGLDERIDESIYRWFGYIERMENDSIGKRVYVGVCGYWFSRSTAEEVD